MRIGFDAKRIFHNGTGLGHYGRTLLKSFADYFPSNEYYLFNPRAGVFHIEGDNLHEIRPQSFLGKIFSSAWRSSGVKKDILRLKVELYHGLSHEIPIGIRRTGVKSIVTIHDLIHERYPEQYKAIDRKIYTRKFKYACLHADHVIAISEQTKLDIIKYYGIDPVKISVCYQSCNPAFSVQIPEQEKMRVRELYGLPPKFFLSVGSIIERKNLLNTCKAFFLLRNEIDIPLVVIGDGGEYKQQVKDFILQHGLKDRIIFLSERTETKKLEGFKTATDFPAIYQLSTGMIYPSFFEGFGIPVLEALASGIPVITSNQSCLPEAGGPGAFYVDPASAEDIAIAIKKILAGGETVQRSIAEGYEHAAKFSPYHCAARVMNLYETVLKMSP